MTEDTQSDPRPTGMLIKADIQRLDLIQLPAEEDAENIRCFKPASYDLRLGHEYIVPGMYEEGLQEAKILDCRQTNQRVLIEPFSSVVVSTYEIVKLPPNVAGKFNLRIKQAFRGLIVQMGTQVEPRYHGRLFALLQNITDRPVAILYKDYQTRPFTIEFQYTSAEVILGPDRKEILTLKEFVSDVRVSNTLSSMLDAAHKAEAENLKKLSDRIEKAEKDQLALDGRVDSELTKAAEWNLLRYGLLLSVGVAAIITVLAPIVLKAVSDVPLADVKATALSEAAKTLSESVRDENERLKKRFDEIQSKEESLNNAKQRNIEAVTMIEAAKSFSDSLRGENEQLKDRVEQMQAKAIATDEALNSAMKRISELEKKVLTPTAAVVAPRSASERKMRRSGQRKVRR